jgi:hypothetical protein
VLLRILTTFEQSPARAVGLGQQRDADSFLPRGLLSPEHQPTPQPQRDTAMSTATTHEPSEITSPQRPGIRRGPRVSNACVNCRRRKVHNTVQCPMSAVWRLTFSCCIGEMYRRQAAVPVLHNLPEALRLRGTRQTSEVSSLSPASVLPVITDLAPDPAYYTDQPMPVSSGWKKNSVSSRAQHLRHRHRLRRAIQRLSALPRQQRGTTARRLHQACNDLARFRRVGIRLLCKAHGRLRLDLRLPVVRLPPIMGRRVPVMMALFMSGGIIGGLRRSGRH